MPEPQTDPHASPRTAHAEGPEPVLGLPLDRADAMLPVDLIQGGEIIILLLKPSPWFIILGCLGHLTALVIITIIASVLSLRGVLPLAHNDTMLVGMIAILVRLAWQFLEWLGRVYVLTDRRVIRRMGVLRLFTFETPLSHVQHTEMINLLRERLFGLGTIAFSTSGTDIPEAYWVMLARPKAVHRKIIQAINRYSPRR
jgi:uncharacterized membrane protein YdbT with pleckstrin-like domain